MQSPLSGHFRPSLQDCPDCAFQRAGSVGRACRRVPVVAPAGSLVPASPLEDPSDLWADAAEVAAILPRQLGQEPVALPQRFLAEQPVTGTARLAEEGLQRSDDQPAARLIRHLAAGKIAKRGVKGGMGRQGIFVPYGARRGLVGFVFVGVGLRRDVFR